MDPDEALRQLRALVKQILDGKPYSEDDVGELAELFDGLDQWLVRGGFAPKTWAAKPPRRNARRRG